MTAFVRPSLILRMDLDDRLFNDEAIANIKRSYSYVAPSLVCSHEPADADRVENVMRFTIKLHRAYWDTSDAEASELWQAVMPKWLHNMFNKVSNTITASNKVSAEEGLRGTDYAWLELEFDENALVALKTASDSSFPEDGVDLVERVRNLMGDNVFGEGIACVRIPSRASYEAQLAAAKEAQAAAEQAAQAERAAQAEGEAETASVAAAIGAPAAAEAEVAPAAQLADDVVVEPEEPAFVAPKLPAFDVDYSTWGIEYESGEVREFDAAAASFK